MTTLVVVVKLQACALLLLRLYAISTKYAYMSDCQIARDPLLVDVLTSSYVLTVFS